MESGVPLSRRRTQEYKVRFVSRMIGGFLIAGSVYGQLSTSAYRVLGQADMRQNGVNMVEGLEMYGPSGVALDARDGVLHLYISDTRNHRVLAWEDARSFQTGDAPALVLGQPSPRHSGPLGIGPKGFNLPAGLAVDPATGNLYVADSGNHRVLRFPNPFANRSRVEPDAFYGQPDVSSRTANAGGISKRSLRNPLGVAFDQAGNLWIADSGNHRLLRYHAAVLDGDRSEADLVIGQNDYTSGAANRGGGVSAIGFDLPFGLTFDLQNNLYVADYNNARVLRFTPPLGPDSAAVAALGQANAASRIFATTASASSMAGRPGGLAVDAARNLYVAVPGDHRILVFPPDAASGAAAREQLGQADFTGTQPNPASFPHAAAGTFSSVSDVKLDAEGNLFVADTGNNRVLSFSRNSRSASRVWGQVDFTCNGINRIKPGSINAPFKMAVDYSQAPYALYVSDTNNHRVLVWRDAARFRSGDPADLVIGQPDFRTAMPNVDTRGAAKPSRTSLALPKGIAVDSEGNLYVADSGNHRVLRYPRPTAQIGRIAPDMVIGQPDFTSSVSAAVSASSLRSPAGVAIAADGGIFVADSGNHRVLEFSAGFSGRPQAIRVYGQPSFTSGVASTAASAQTLSTPQGIFVDAAYTLYVADTGSHRVMVYPNTRDGGATGSAASIVIGQNRFDAAAPGLLQAPVDVVLDSTGIIYISDSGHSRVLAFPSLIYLPLAGAAPIGALGQREADGTDSNWNSADGLATPEGLWAPLGLYIDRRDTLYVGDSGNNRVLHFLKAAAPVHAATNQAGVPLARGSLAIIKGAGGFSDEEEKSSTTPWPLALAGREVVVNEEIRAPLSSVAPGEIGLQIPAAAPLGRARVAVRIAETGELVAGSIVSLAAAAPGLFARGADVVEGRILNEDGSANGPSSASLKGGVIRIFGTGQGPVSPPVADGEVAPSEPAAHTVAVPTSDGQTCLSRQPSVCVAIGNTFGEIQFSGLAPGEVGTWQITLKVPVNAPSGNAVPLRAIINGAPTNIITVAIR